MPFPKGAFHHTTEARARISAANRGRVRSLEVRARISAVRRRQCADPVWRAAWRPFGGRRHSEESKARIRAASRRHAAADLPNCRCWLHNQGFYNTALSLRMVETFLREFPEVQTERRFGPYRVDAYLPPPYHLAFEADGVFWHDLPGRREHDAARDAYLLREWGLPVIRLSEAEIIGVAI